VRSSSPPRSSSVGVETLSSLRSTARAFPQKRAVRNPPGFVGEASRIAFSAAAKVSSRATSARNSGSRSRMPCGPRCASGRLERTPRVSYGNGRKTKQTQSPRDCLSDFLWPKVSVPHCRPWLCIPGCRTCYIFLILRETRLPKISSRLSSSPSSCLRHSLGPSNRVSRRSSVFRSGFSRRKYILSSLSLFNLSNVSALRSFQSAHHTCHLLPPKRTHNFRTMALPVKTAVRVNQIVCMLFGIGRFVSRSQNLAQFVVKFFPRFLGTATPCYGTRGSSRYLIRTPARVSLSSRTSSGASTQHTLS